MKRLLCAIVLLAALTPDRALAFSDYEVFGLAPLEGGGGGGRYFTTSPIDGYGCGVCHTGGIEPVVQIFGLPETGYVPGAAYDIVLTWLFSQIPHSLNLEIVNAAGQAAGTISVPTELEAADRCAVAPNDPAAHLIEEAAPRQILWMNACGSSRLRFRFVAPADPEITFAASIVRSDMSEKPEGDGVLEIRRVLSQSGSAPQSSSCSAPRSAASAAGLPAWLGVAALAFVLLALRVRKASRSLRKSRD
jgi:hypothetical protein